MKKVNSILLSLMMLAAIGAAFAQTGNTSGGGTTTPTAVRSDAGIAPVFPSMIEPITTGGLLDDTLVKNKPLAAAFESETVQILPNGTSVRRRVTTRIYRDSEGRTRREQTFNASTIPSPGEMPQTVSIYDPVEGYRYSINVARRTGDRYKLPSAPPQGAPFNDRIPLSVEILRSDNPQTGTVKKYKLEPPRVEALGKQTINGVEAEGLRVTFKVPAGAMGSANPIETVYETWIARELRLLVKSVVRNPVSGEHTFRLTAINRAEQPRSLFDIPPSYQITDMGVPRPNAPPPTGATTP